MPEKRIRITKGRAIKMRLGTKYTISPGMAVSRETTMVVGNK